MLNPQATGPARLQRQAKGRVEQAIATQTSDHALGISSGITKLAVDDNFAVSLQTQHTERIWIVRVDVRIESAIRSRIGVDARQTQALIRTYESKRSAENDLAVRLH